MMKRCRHGYRCCPIFSRGPLSFYINLF